MGELNHEALFIQTVLQLADKYGVKAEIDYDNCYVNFKGDCDQEALAISWGLYCFFIGILYGF
ncbi:MAG: hypothetical protein ACFFCW_00215 [Candidatus Hodarchaeota archaeon]